MKFLTACRLVIPAIPRTAPLLTAVPKRRQAGFNNTNTAATPPFPIDTSGVVVDDEDAILFSPSRQSRRGSSKSFKSLLSRDLSLSPTTTIPPTTSTSFAVPSNSKVSEGGDENKALPSAPTPAPTPTPITYQVQAPDEAEATHLHTTRSAHYIDPPTIQHYQPEAPFVGADGAKRDPIYEYAIAETFDLWSSNISPAGSFYERSCGSERGYSPLGGLPTGPGYAGRWAVRNQ